ncbi:MAG: winged helix-turn-helix domain-containing protein [Anaerocolumna sp.]
MEDNNKTTILVADDDEDIWEILEILLKAEGFEVIMASDGNEAVRLADAFVDLIILDVAMPEKNSFLACKEIREKSVAPVLFLTAKSQVSDKALGFSAGGDDYLPKPFSNAELIYRVKALLRRCYQYQPLKKEENNIYKIGPVTINANNKTVTADHQQVILTPLEYDILELMARYPKKVFSAQNIYESIWNQDYTYLENNIIVVHISNLRKKIEKDPKNPEIIKSMWGRGYYVEESNKTIGILYKQRIEQRLDLVIGAVCVILFCFAIMREFKLIVKDILTIEKGIHILESGDRSFLIQTNRKDEIADLADSINRMSKELMYQK